MSEAAPVETSATALVHRLTVALRVACLYGPENVVVQESIAALVPTLTGYLARSGKAVVLGEKGLVYVNGRLLRPGTGSSWLSEWNELLERNELGGLFLAGVWDEDAVLELLAGFSEASSKRGGERVARLRDTCRRVVTPAVLELFSPSKPPATPRSRRRGTSPRPLAAFYYARLVALAEASGQMARLHGNPDLYTRLSQQSVGKLIRHLDERAFEHELLRMTAYPPENDVEANAVHAANVAILAVLMGRLLGLSAAELTDLGFAALEHDLGRSDGGEDDPALHVPMGVALCLRGSGTGSGNRARLIVAREHHGPSDGHPAPEPPHLFSRLVSLADAYDRLETGDDDTPPLSPRAALAALELGERFAPGLIELLRDVVGDAPRGTLLRLPEGGTGLVVEGGARRCRRPLVWELLDPDGMTLDAVRLREVDPDEVVEETERVLDWRTALLRPLPHDLLLAQGTGVDLDSLPTSAMATQAGFGTAGPDAAEVEDAAEAPAEAAAADIDEAAPAKAPAYEVDEGHMLLSDDMTRAYAIGRRLGSGGQGTVYEVFIQGEHAFGSDATQVERAVVKVAHSDFDGLWRERDIYALEVPGLIQMSTRAGRRPTSPT